MNIFEPITSSEEDKEKLLDRFIRYAKTYSESCSDNADNGTLPSTSQQIEFAKMIFEELKSLPLQNLTLTQTGYVYAYFPATKEFENAPSILLVAHIDTSEETSGKNVNPRVIKNYTGGKIEYPGFDFVLDSENDEALARAAQNRETIITSDGSTLLGADDKAGVAEIIAAAEWFASHPEASHRAFEILFSPDEETGHGMDNVPLDIIKSKIACTVDGGDIGGLESECFNAYGATITFTGKSTHTGAARKGKMINSITVLSHFLTSLPHTMTPETTDGYQGFIAPLEIAGGIEESHAYLLLRSFSMEGIEEQKKIISAIAEATAVSFGAKSNVIFKQQYLNMKQKIDADRSCIRDMIEKAFTDCGVMIVKSPIRGGTDGSRLTEMGIPTPNIFTGGHNFHSRNEWASLNQMCKSTDILIRLLSVN